MRWTSRLPAAVAALAFAWCGTAAAEDLYGTLKKAKESGAITIGYREASLPFSYIGPDGKPIGYAIDICLRIVEAAKTELKMDKLEVKYVPVNGQTRIPLLVNGTIDIECGSTTNNLTRGRQVDFLLTTFVTGTKLLVKKASGIKEIEDMKGKTIAISSGTTNEKAVKEVNEKLKLGMKIIEVKDHPQAWIALESDRVDAYGTDHVLEFGLISKAKNPADYAVVGRFLSVDPYSIMIRRDDSAFRLVGNTVLSDLYRSGEIKTIYKKWFDTIDMPLGEDLAAAFELQALPY